MKFYLLILLVGVGGCCTIKPQFPNITPAPVNFDPPPQSVINIPVAVDFSAKVPEIDQKINEQFPIAGGQNDCNLTYNYNVAKSAQLAIAFDATNRSQINFSTQLSVGAGATYCAVCVNLFGRRCVVPKIGASCGQNGESPRRVKVSFSSPIDVAPNYTLASNVNIRDLYFIDPCRVTFLNIDISGIITDQARRRIPIAAVNERVASVSIRNQVQNVWNFLGSNIVLEEGLVLKINPHHLAKGPITGANQTIQTTIGLVASPEITSDITPSTPAPLPDLQPVTGEKRI